ncbi:CLUMA_CG020312, isoform A [Clunio marinus]|uniref:CLUMA_CG020312, isoform A n=1 Tax=Clunio marinus TaxID=568069 RepID=A0A1J1J4J6_9DIPT|nr:CLUMA_CG020312, isoform A [Clunio marinus]
MKSQYIKINCRKEGSHALTHLKQSISDFNFHRDKETALSLVSASMIDPINFPTVTLSTAAFNEVKNKNLLLRCNVAISRLENLTFK